MDLRLRIALLVATVSVACGSGATNGDQPTATPRDLPSVTEPSPRAKPTPSPVPGTTLAPGAFDPAFGDGGIVRVPFDSSVRPHQRGLWVAPDGSVHVVVRAALGVDRETLTIELRPNGTLPEFGIASPLPLTTEERTVVVTPSGRFLVSTPASGDDPSSVVRLQDLRTVDTTFGDDGVVYLDFERVTIHPLFDGGALVRVGNRDGTGDGIIRLNEDGSRDLAFGMDGVASPNIDSDAPASYGIGATDDAGRIFLPVVLAQIGQPVSMLALRADGSIDESFGTDGLSVVVGGFGARDVEITAEREVVVLHGNGLTRITPDGRQIERVPRARSPSALSNIRDIAITTNGYVLLAGGAGVPGENHPRCPTRSNDICYYAIPAVQAVGLAGVRPPAFGEDGVRIDRNEGEGFQGSGSWSVVVGPPGKITVAGSVCTNVNSPCDLIVFRIGAP